MRLRNLSAALTVFVFAFMAVPALAAVHPGDELIVTVYEHPELTGPVSVDSSDHISLPLAGSVDVHGLTTNQIAGRVQSALARYVIKPGVNVQMKTQLPVVFISGGPGGTLAYSPGETLVAALGTLAPRMQQPLKDLGTTTNQNSSFSDLERSALDLRRVGIVRDDRTIGTYDALALFSQGTSGPALQAGDTLAIANKPILVRVAGDVERPGNAYLAADEPLADALFQAGGLRETASTARIDVRGDAQPELLAQGDPRWNRPATTTMAITVPVAPRINIAGLVDKPGPVSLKTDQTLVTALYQAGGPTKWADLRDVSVMQNGVSTTYDITKLTHGDLSQNPQLHDGDTVFVPEGHKIAYGQIFQTILGAPFYLIGLRH